MARYPTSRDRHPPSTNDRIVELFDNGNFGDGDVLGCDFVGTVEEIGDAVSKLSKGDIIAGIVLGGIDHYCETCRNNLYKVLISYRENQGSWRV